MAILTFTLNPEAIERFHNAISCLAKFSETITLEATRDHFVITTLNSTNSAYAAFSFSAARFFAKYDFNPIRTNGVAKEKFACRIYNRALYSVFRGRLADPMREKDTGVERCEVSIEDGLGEIKSRFAVKIVCRHGVLKVYKLTFEAVAPAHAFFDAEGAQNKWSISSRVLRDVIEHFGTGTEQLDVYLNGDKVNFTSFTEKIVSGNDVLKAPLNTTIALDTLEFSDLTIEDKMHIVMSVKDFKAIAMHAGTGNTTVSVAYSRPQKPLQIRYADGGMTSEYVLMTIGEYRGNSVTPAAAPVRTVKRPIPKPLENLQASRQQSSASMGPPARSVAPSVVRELGWPSTSTPSIPEPQPDIAPSNPMFFTDADDDARWDPAVDDDDEDMGALGWDSNTNLDANSAYRPSLQNNAASSQRIVSLSRQQTHSEYSKLPPTQRISQIRGMFDE